MPRVNPDSKYLKLLKDQDWTSLLEDIAIYAAIYFRRFSPNERQELIHHAIEKVLTGDQAWDSAKYTKLIDHLKWVLKSVASNEAKLAYNLKRIRSVPDEEGVLINPIELVSDSHPLEDEVLIVKSNLEEIREVIKGDEEAELVFLAYEEEGARKPSEAAEMTGYDIDTVNNALKRIRRRWLLISQRGDHHE